MINKVIFSLDINGNSLIIKVDDKNNVTDTQIEAQKKLQEAFALSERQAKQLWKELSQPIENISIEDLNNTIEKIINSANLIHQKTIPLLFGYRSMDYLIHQLGVYHPLQACDTEFQGKAVEKDKVYQ